MLGDLLSEKGFLKKVTFEKKGRGIIILTGWSTRDTTACAIISRFTVMCSCFLSVALEVHLFKDFGYSFLVFLCSLTNCLYF